MVKSTPCAPRRTRYLAVGMFAMLFSGVLYAWSILKIPFSEDFGWSADALSLNFTLTMCFFCLGAIVGSLLCRRCGPRVSLIVSGILVGCGFSITAFLTPAQLILLYVAYAACAGFGIGIAYNVVVSTVTAWYPDRKGFCSGCLMMGFGFSTLLLGNGISILFDAPAVGPKKTFLLLAAVLAAVLVTAAMILRAPTPDTPLPKPAARRTDSEKDGVSAIECTTAQMLRRFSFWRAFLCLAFITAVGNSVISFARDLALSVDASPSLATTLVGVLAVCNGLGRILTGAVFDALGRRTTMIAANALTITAAAITLTAVLLHSLPVCIAGLCLTGLSYGSSPTLTSAFTSAFYGQKHFSVNYSITNCNLIVAAFIASLCSNLMTRTGGFTAPFVLLLLLSVCALVLNITVRRP